MNRKTNIYQRCLLGSQLSSCKLKLYRIDLVNRITSSYEMLKEAHWRDNSTETIDSPS